MVTNEYSNIVRVVVMRRHIEENQSGVDLKPVLRIYNGEAQNEDDYILTYGVKLAEAEVKYSCDQPLFGKFHVWIEGVIRGA